MFKKYEIEIEASMADNVVTGSYIKEIIEQALKKEELSGNITNFSVCVDDPRCRSIKAREYDPLGLRGSSYEIYNIGN